MRIHHTLLLLGLTSAFTPALSAEEDLYEGIDLTKNIFLTEKRVEGMKEDFEALLRSDLKPQDLVRVYVNGVQLGTEYMRNGQYIDAINQWNDCQKFARQYKLPLGQEDLKFITYNEALAQILAGDRDNREAGIDGRFFTLPVPKDIKVPHTEAYTAAVQLLEKHLFNTIEDDDAKYLLNLAYMKLGKYPSKPFSGWRFAEEGLQDKASSPRFEEVASKIGLSAQMRAGSVIVDDFDLDNDDDVLISSAGFNEHLRYFENQGHGKYVERTEDAGLLEIKGISNLASGDLNKDGLPDVYAMRGTYMGAFGADGSLPDVLLLNRKGHFENITPEIMSDWRAPTVLAYFRDMNIDGWLDIVALSSSEGNESGVRIYYNDRKLGFTLAHGSQGMPFTGDIEGAVISDFNQNIFPDTYYSLRRSDNVFYFHNGFDFKSSNPYENSNIETLDPSDPVLNVNDGGPCIAYDADNDGWLDIISFLNFDFSPGTLFKGADALKLQTPINPPKMFINNSGNGFVEYSIATAFNQTISVGGNAVTDLNNDSNIDLIVGSRCPSRLVPMPSRAYINKPGQGFREITFSSGMGTLHKVNSVAIADYDFDGDNDVFMATGGSFNSEKAPLLVYNNPGNDNDWIGIRLVGSLGPGSPSGVRITLNVQTPTGPNKIYYFYNRGSGNGQGSGMKIIGLGDIRSIDSVDVTWQSMKGTQTYELIKPNHHYVLVEGMILPKQLD